jgi:hypothetical protein
MFGLTLNTIGVTPRTTTFTSAPSSLRFMEATIASSGDAIGCPCASRATCESTESALSASRPIPEVISDVDPRCVMIAFSGDPPALSASRKPAAIAVSTMRTATTSAMPPIASSVTRPRT